MGGVQRRRSRWRAVLEKVARFQVGAVSGGEGAALGAVPVGCGPWWRPAFRAFFPSPDPHFIFFQSGEGFSRSCVGVLGVFISEDPEAVGVSYDVQRAQMCAFFLSVRGSMLLMMFSRG